MKTSVNLSQNFKAWVDRIPIKIHGVGWGEEGKGNEGTDTSIFSAAFGVSIVLVIVYS